jgi:hypothetical protein
MVGSRPAFAPGLCALFTWASSVGLRITGTQFT